MCFSLADKWTRQQTFEVGKISICRFNWGGPVKMISLMKISVKIALCSHVRMSEMTWLVFSAWLWLASPCGLHHIGAWGSSQLCAQYVHTYICTYITSHIYRRNYRRARQLPIVSAQLPKHAVHNTVQPCACACVHVCVCVCVQSACLNSNLYSNGAQQPLTPADGCRSGQPTPLTVFGFWNRIAHRQEDQTCVCLRDMRLSFQMSTGTVFGWSDGWPVCVCMHVCSSRFACHKSGLCSACC